MGGKSTAQDIINLVLTKLIAIETITQDVANGGASLFTIIDGQGNLLKAFFTNLVETKVASTEKVKSLAKKMKKKNENQFILQLNNGDIPSWGESASRDNIAVVEPVARAPPSRATAIGSPTALSPSSSQELPTAEKQVVATTHPTSNAMPPIQVYINELDKLLVQLPKQHTETNQERELKEAVNVLDDLTSLLNESVLYNK